MGYYYMLFLTLTCLLNFHPLVRSEESNLDTYIVHVKLPSSIPFLGSLTNDDLPGWYQKFLPSTSSNSSTEKPRILYSYHNVFKGFAARLSPEQTKAMEKIPGFVSVRPQRVLSLHTTHTPNFLGLSQNMGVWRDTNYGRGVIIGVLDTGINPNHPSFSDEGMPSPPANWRGTCQFTSVACNNKLIGARYFTIGDGTPFDENGHGSHTASTAGGNFVSGANVFGNANGTASGIAPLAHIAMYKVCTSISCSEIDILAAMDAAIDDGVDVISLSIGGDIRDFYEEAIAVGAFSAIERGIFVSASAGNSGPSQSTVDNGAPWILTVGASTTDRKIKATVVLGNNDELDGESTFQPLNFPSTLLPLVYPGAISLDPNATFCTPESLRNIDVQGRIVLCDVGLIGAVAKGRAVRDAGGAAMIVVNLPTQGYTVPSDAHVLPAAHLSYEDGERVKVYLILATSPTATISFRGTIIGDTHAPAVASFSSRGPNLPSQLILKPDIIGPGHNILAAWHVSVENNANTNSNFNIISGTSMSCPHLSGVAALLKSAHPDWSPAAIKSAIMTTADQVNLAGNPIEDETQTPANIFATGAGHVNILRAMNPGMIYDISPQDYVPYLCGLGYTDQQVEIIVNRVVSCAGISSIPQPALNYPSIVIVLSPGSASQTYSRTVTNVGSANSVYTATIDAMPGLNMVVQPSTLQFSALNQSLTYQMTFSRLAGAISGTFVQGSVTWTSANYTVRIPVVCGFA